MENALVSNVHELAYANFLSSNPANITRILTKFYQVSMVVYRAGNISYNASMMANTVITDFVSQFVHLFAREMCLEFVEYVMTLLYCSDGFWDFVNRLNVHLFYLTYRGQMMEALSLKMASMYGSDFVNLVREVPPIRDGDTPTTRGNWSKLITLFNFFRNFLFLNSFSSKHLSHYPRSPKKTLYSYFSSCAREALERKSRRRWPKRWAFSECRQGIFKMLKYLFSGTPFLVQIRNDFMKIQNDAHLNWNVSFFSNWKCLLRFENTFSEVLRMPPSRIRNASHYFENAFHGIGNASRDLRMLFSKVWKCFSQLENAFQRIENASVLVL